jgi:bifunctional non-homologous end joining protein LigD
VPARAERRARMGTVASRGVAEKTSKAVAKPKKVPSSAAVQRLVKKGEQSRILEQLDQLCASERNGTLEFSDGRRLSVTNLDKVFFKRERYTKGDLLRYYTLVAPLILPATADRPLVLKRFPHGIEGQAFYQQTAPPDTPRDVRVESVVNDVGERQRRFIGGDLLTLLYTIQLGAISVDPWHSHLPDLDFADYAVVDLDPGPRAGFRRVIDVARWVKDVMDKLKLHAALKTSGATGLHVYIPLPAHTPNEAATLVAQLIATRVADEHPKQATVMRWVKQRGAATVYVDYLQNIKGKTLAGPYCVRAKEGATVSTPLRWEELDDNPDPRDFTIVSAPERFATVGDIWNSTMRRRNSLAALVGQ